MSPSAVTPERFVTFGELLKFLRRQAHMTQAELALAVGYSDAQISRMERDERIPDSSTVTALLVPALGIDKRPEWVGRLVDLAEAAHAADAIQNENRPRAEQRTPPAHNFLSPLTSFIGRKKEIGEVKARLANHRLVTIAGPGGMGKTRLSFQLANELLFSFPGGIWLVELAPLSEPSLVSLSLANALGLREAGERESLIRELILMHLRPRKALLLFDNCEHLIEEVARLVETILRECPDVSILTTSREALRLDGESVYQLPPLIAPQAGAQLDALMESESVRLFVERAREAQPGFRVLPQDAPMVASICRHLDGIPLALELAAARVKMMTVNEIDQRLDDRFRLLTGGARTSLPRQQTLRASMDWSYHLLAEKEQRLLAMLSIFVDGWTLGAVETICWGKGLDTAEVLDLVTSLIDKSLVAVHKSEADSRYRMLETVRQYAYEKLLETGEESGVRDEHLDYYMRLAEEAEPKLQGGEQLSWFDRLEAEKGNFRAAMDWSLKAGQPEKGLRLAAALFFFWEAKGYWLEGYVRLHTLMDQKEIGQDLVWAKSLIAAGTLASECGYWSEMHALFDEGIQALRYQGAEGKQFLGFALAQYAKAFIDRDVRQGQRLAEEAVRASREANDPVGLAYSLYAMGMMTRRVSDFETARITQGESMELFRKMGNQSYYSLLMSNLAYTYYFQGDLAEAAEYFDRSMQIAREIGDRYSEANSIPGRGDIFRRAGDFEAAETLLLKGLAFHREIGSAHQGLVNHLHILGLLELSRGDPLKAGEFLQEGAMAAGKGNLLHFLRFVIDAMGYLASSTEPLRAARLFGAAEMLRNQLGTPLYPVEHADYDRYSALARAQVSEADWETAWNEGYSMAVEQVIERALKHG